MSVAASAIAGEAATFTGVVRPSFIKITLVDDAGKPISNLKLEIGFEEDNQTTEVASDTQGIIMIPTKTGNLVVKLTEKTASNGKQRNFLSIV